MALAIASGGEPRESPAVLARDAMSRDVLTVDQSGNFREALNLLLERQIHALPVTRNDCLVGMISSRDFLREFSYGELPGSRQPIASFLVGMFPDSIRPDTGLNEALEVMRQSARNCLTVAVQEQAAGVVSQRDIVREQCRLLEQAEYHPEMPQDGSVMCIARQSPALGLNSPLCEAAAAMIDHSLPAVTIADRSGKLLGLVTEDDILRVLYDALE
jgi:CBS domain-containing protein